MTTINVALAGAGAFGIKHLEAIKAINGVKVSAARPKRSRGSTVFRMPPPISPRACG